MNRYEKASTLSVEPRAVYDWHVRPGALQRLTPPWQVIRSSGSVSGLERGSRVKLVMGRGLLRTTWIAEHTRVEPGRGFEDVQVKGPFRYWRHAHRFEPWGEDMCVLRDSIEYLIPGGTLGRWLAGKQIERSIAKTFEYRHQATADDLAFHRRYSSGRRLRVAITGASGLIGSTLASILSTGGHEVICLVRAAPAAGPYRQAQWDPRRGVLETEKVEGLDAVVHLAGENISRRHWTKRQMERIRRSRVEATANLVQSLGALDRPPGIFLAASAIGIYGDRGDELLTEESPHGCGFLADVCQEWEEAAAAAERWASRVVSARFGMVLSPQGGALAKMLPAFRLGGGGKIGSGEQVMSWISIDDVGRALVHILQTPELEGPVNLVSPGSLPNREFTKSLANTLNRPAMAPLPSILARALFGRMAEEILLSGSRVEPTKLLASGYEFRHPELGSSLSFLLGRG